MQWPSRVGSPAPFALRAPIARRTRVVLLASAFYPQLSRALVQGARDVLRRAGVAAARIRLVWVPGAFELPVVAARLATRAPRPHAIIALGALIRGETPQFAVLAHAVAHGLQAVAVRARIPVTCGVIVATTVAQAKARAGGRLGNRGAEAAQAALGVLSIRA